MYDGFENSISVHLDGKFLCYVIAKKIKFGQSLVQSFLSSIGFLPPFNVECNFSESEFTMILDMFNEFDSRKLTPPQQERLAAAVQELLGKDSKVTVGGSKLNATTPIENVQEFLNEIQ